MRENGERLAGAALWFRDRHPRHAFLAEAFSILVEARRRHIQRRDAPLDLTGLQRRLDTCLRNAAVDGGPLAETAALHLIDCLLQAGEWKRCEKELNRFQTAFGGKEEAGAEFAMLRAELWMETDRVAQARMALERLAEQRPANRAHRARTWGLLALCEQKSGQALGAERSAAAAWEALAHVQDGFTRAWVSELAAHLRTATAPPARPMPYQQAEDDERWCGVGHNLEKARLHVAESVYRRYPGYTVEQLAAVMGRGPSWLYAFLGRHRDVAWVRELLQP